MRAQSRQMQSRQIAAWLVVTGMALAPASAFAWGARKQPAVEKPRSKPKASGTKPKTTSADRVAPALADRVAALLAQARPAPTEALRLLREATGAREMALAVQLAEAIAAAPSVPPSVLVEAATVIGMDHPVQRRLWQRAWQAGRGHPSLARQIAEGHADALLAAGDPDAAQAVVDAALARSGRGLRRTLLERLVAIARQRGDLETAVERLRALADPDAAVLGAQLEEELGNEDAAAAWLRSAWKAYPGSRTLQAAYLALLQRLGLREELARTVDQVVRLAPADPMPWLTVLDAHIAARDPTAARALVDDLARRHARHDVLIEALIDREQRLGEDPKRLVKLFELLLRAAPNEPQYVEAYAEWLFARPGDPMAVEAAALAVLARLARMPAGEFDGLQRQAALLLAHNRLTAARQVAERMLKLRPDEPRAERMLAMLDEREGRTAAAEKRWLALTVLPDPPSPADRSRAGEARQALASLYRKNGALGPKVREVRDLLVRARPTLGWALLYYELHGQLTAAAAKLAENSRDDDAEWLALAERVRKQFPTDSELLQVLAVGLVQRGRAQEALGVLEDLARTEPETAEPLLAAAVEAALAAGDVDLARRAETLLLYGPDAGPGHRAVAPAGVLLRLGDVHLRYGDAPGAAALFKRAAAASPHDTRATARLATLFRLAGAWQDEAQALRDIVQRAEDPDELDAAGQRLLTLALASGRTAELVRWLDSVGPQHARRELIDRLRIGAYDLYLRSAPLDQALGLVTTPPSPSPVGEALASGDLATQVRALRQLGLARKPVPLALARQLLQSSNPVLRRDTALALGASGTEGAAKVLVEAMNVLDNDDEVVCAELVALTQLPPVPGIEPLLVSLLTRSESAISALAAYGLGRLGGERVLGVVHNQLAVGRREFSAAALVALGALAGRFPHHPQVPAMTLILLDQAAMSSTSSEDPGRLAAALWALAASGQPAARAALITAALDAQGPTLRRMALALYAAPQPPALPALASGIGADEGMREIRQRLLRDVLTPWLAPTADSLRLALKAHDEPLATAWQARMGRGGLTAAGRTPSAPAPGGAWCDTWPGVVEAESRVGRLCAAAVP